MLLRNLRQQVMEGARLIARAASNISIEWFPFRSMFISHARDEHRDFQMLERDYCAVGAWAFLRCSPSGTVRSIQDGKSSE